MSMNPGDVFEGRYRIVRELGAGGFATVFLAEHIQIGQLVAIKMLLEPGSDARFLREGQILARLTSPSTVRILDFGEADNGYPYMISEYVEGETLADVMSRGPLPPAGVVGILEQVLESLSEAHALGIIHRDIKPANIMLLPGGRVKVLDFGIARVAQAADVEGLTASGIVIGTPRYLAPEVLLNPESIQPSADIFAVGLVAYALLTGVEANEGLTSRKIVARHLSSEPYNLPPNVAAPRFLRDWIAGATLKISTDRFADATIALHELHSGAARETEVPDADPVELGTREIELDLGDGELLDLKIDPRPAPTQSTVAVAQPNAARRPPRTWPWVLGLIIVVALIGGGVVVKSRLTKMREYVPSTNEPQPEDPPDVVRDYDAGKTAFEAKDWIEALRYFKEVAAQPTTIAAADLERRGYVGRAIANVLEEAIDAREEARTKKQFELAAEGPSQVLELFPEHEATKEVLVSIAEAEQPKARRKNRDKQRKIEIRRVH